MDLHREIIKTGKLMVKQGLVASTWGNISVKLSDDEILVTPSGMEYSKLKPSDLVLVNLEGQILEGCRKPSSELPLHLAFYKYRKDINAVVHTHSIYASAYAALRKPIPPLIEDMAMVIGGPVNVASYALPGTKELAQNAVEALGDKGAVLLANHGVIGVGSTLAEAYKACLLAEKTAHISLAAQIMGEPVALNSEEVKIMREAYLTSYGQK
ncbi:MAG: class II aldolase/adducin family protein [Clostridia bacterium]|nr:class II aldolase/adducin family protein [Clostridia bacterium]